MKRLTFVVILGILLTFIVMATSYADVGPTTNCDFDGVPPYTCTTTWTGSKTCPAGKDIRVIDQARVIGDDINAFVLISEGWVNLWDGPDPLGDWVWSYQKVADKFIPADGKWHLVVRHKEAGADHAEVASAYTVADVTTAGVLVWQQRTKVICVG